MRSTSPIVRGTRFGSVRVLLGAGVVLVGAWSCAGSATPPVATPTPVPVDAPIPVPVLVAPTRYNIPQLVTDTRYRVRSDTELERDSSGTRDVQRLSSSADVVVRTRRTATGNFSATGRISRFRVTSALSTTPIAIDSLRFEAVLDGSALRVVMQPPLANECDRPETGALALVRDLMVRVPSTVAVGDQWRDSTVQLVCRSNVPLVVRTVSEYVVVDSSRDRSGVALLIRRSSRTRLEGKSTSPWRSVEVMGEGTSTVQARVSVFSGAVAHIEGVSDMTMTVTDRTTPTTVRTQQVMQRVKVTGDIAGD